MDSKFIGFFIIFNILNLFRTDKTCTETAKFGTNDESDYKITCSDSDGLKIYLKIVNRTEVIIDCKLLETNRKVYDLLPVLNESYLDEGSSVSFAECPMPSHFSFITAKIPKIVSVDFAGMSNEYLNYDFFDEESNLTYLNFWNNDLESIDIGAFKNLKYLEKIDLSVNNFMELSWRLFVHNANLKHFILNFNRNAEDLVLENYFLSNRTKLLTVSIAYNKRLKYIPRTIFSDSTNIEEINLNNNKLAELNQ